MSYLIILSFWLQLVTDNPRDTPNVSLHESQLVDSLYFPPLGSDDWETISMSSLGWNIEAVPELEDFVANTNTRALLILKNGRLVYETYAGRDLRNKAPFGKEKYWYWASAAKTLTSFLVGRAESQGFLSIDDPTTKYLGRGWSSMNPEQEDQILIRHQLTMTTGLDYSLSDPYCTEPACIKFLENPGQNWFYHNAPYTLLDKVIEGATDMSFDDYFNSQLLKKIGMKGFWTYRGYNHIFFSPPRSMARFGLLILAKGVWDGVSILENDSFYKRMISSSQELNPSYGYLWWLNGKGSFIPPATSRNIPSDLTPNAPDDLISADGKNGQLINIVPSQQLVIVRVGDNIDTNSSPLYFQNKLWESLNKLIVN